MYIFTILTGSYSILKINDFCELSSLGQAGFWLDHIIDLEIVVIIEQIFLSEKVSPLMKIWGLGQPLVLPGGLLLHLKTARVWN